MERLSIWGSFSGERHFEVPFGSTVTEYHEWSLRQTTASIAEGWTRNSMQHELLLLTVECVNQQHLSRVGGRSIPTNRLPFPVR